MSNCVRGSAPWLSSVDDNNCCTVVEGAEVVRTAAVSYATPILHQVFIKNSSTPYRTVVTGSQQNPCYNFKNHFSTSSSSEREDKTSLSSTCVSPSDGPLHTKPAFRKKVEALLDPVCSEAYLISSSSIKLPSSFTPSSSPSSKPSSTQSSEAVSSCHLVWSSSPSSSPQSPSSDVTAFALPLVSSSVNSNESLSSPTSPSLALNLSSSSPLPESRPDDELTSLSWLQDSNLLRGTTLTSLKPNKSSSLGNATPERKRQRPAKKEKSDAGEVTALKSSSSFRREIEDDSKEGSQSSDSAEEPNGELEQLEPCQNETTNHPVPYNPKVHTMAKPPFSFSCLIFMAIEESSSKALPVKDIYTWIVDHYPYYKSAPTGWKNSVRHNLSLNKCFSKVEKAPSLGKGSLWMVDPNHRPNLLQAMSKAPFTSVSPLDRTYTLSSKSMVNSDWQYNITQKIPETDGKYDLGDVTHKSAEESLNIPLSGAEILCSPMYRKSTSSPKLRIPTRQYHRNTSHDTSSRRLNSAAVLCNDNNNLDLVSNNNNYVNKNSRVNNITVPNPELFPRLAKRLELNSFYESHLNTGSYAIDVQIEDVDAATAMLVLKHGPQMLSPLSETCNPLRKIQNFSAHALSVGDKRKRDNHLEYSADVSRTMYISSSPSVDHSYVSPRENGAYDDENIKPFNSEFRSYNDHPLEEASALLNLASIATSLASKRDENNCRSPVGIPYSDETHSVFAETQSETQSKKTAKKNSIVNKRKLSTKNVNKLQSEFAITVNSRLSSRKLYKPKAKILSLGLDGELNVKPSKVAKSRYNNNSKDVLNRNKLLKVKKLCLRRHKAC